MNVGDGLVPPGPPGPGQVGSGLGRGWSDPGYLSSPDRALDTEPRALSQAVIGGRSEPDLTRPGWARGRGCPGHSQPAQYPLSGAASPSGDNGPEQRQAGKKATGPAPSPGGQARRGEWTRPLGETPQGQCSSRCEDLTGEETETGPQGGLSRAQTRARPPGLPASRPDCPSPGPLKWPLPRGPHLRRPGQVLSPGEETAGRGVCPPPRRPPIQGTQLLSSTRDLPAQVVPGAGPPPCQAQHVTCGLGEGKETPVPHPARAS